MKKTLLTLLLICGISAVYAQKTIPAIKKGTNLFYTAFVQGSEIPVLFTVGQLDNGADISWSVDGYGDGGFKMSAKAMESGNIFYTAQPSPGAPVQLGDNETYTVISKGALKSLVDTKSFTYNGMKFTQKATQTPFKVGGKEIDAIHAATEDGKTELWVLNNPAFPLLLQSVGMGIDVTLTDVK